MTENSSASSQHRRVTTTLELDPDGRATKVQDRAGRICQTTYRPDGQVSKVEQIVGSSAVPVVEYTYGSAGLTNGMPLSVSDKLSDIVQTFDYFAATDGPVKQGQVKKVTEDRTKNGVTMQYSSEYDLNEFGDRSSSTYVTPSGTSVWYYRHYITVGLPESPKRVFETLTRGEYANGNWQMSKSEEFHYRRKGIGKSTLPGSRP